MNNDQLSSGVQFGSLPDDISEAMKIYLLDLQRIIRQRLSGEVWFDSDAHIGGNVYLICTGTEFLFWNVLTCTLTAANITVTATLTTQGGRVKNTTRYTSTQTILVSDEEVFCNGTFTVTLPIGVNGQTFRIINSGTGTITITSSELIIGSTSDVILNTGDVIILTFETTDKWW